MRVIRNIHIIRGLVSHSSLALRRFLVYSFSRLIAVQGISPVAFCTVSRDAPQRRTKRFSDFFVLFDDCFKNNNTLVLFASKVGRKPTLQAKPQFALPRRENPTRVAGILRIHVLFPDTYMAIGVPRSRFFFFFLTFLFVPDSKSGGVS